MPTQPVQVKLPGGGVLTYDRSARRWNAEGAVKPADLDRANEMAAEYVYSTADGYPGCLHATEVARALGGEAVLPEPPPAPEGAMD